MSEPRFLVVRLGSLGDIVHTFPAVAALRESFPSAGITWLTHPRWKLLVQSSRIASEVWSVDSRSLSSARKAIRQVRQSKWTASIDYQGLWKSASLPFLGRVRRRIGFSSDTVREFGVPVLYTERVKVHGGHIAEQNGELSQKVGARGGTAPFCLQVPPEDETAIRQTLAANKIGRYVVLSPGGGWRSKCWPPGRFGILAQRIRQSLGLRCVVNVGPGEENLAGSVRAAAGDPPPLFYNAPLGQLMALLTGATCIVGGDTGPLHLGIALGAPAVALFGPTDPARNGPFHLGGSSGASAGNEIVLRASGAHTTHSRGDRPDSSMLEISADSVFEAVRRRIGLVT